MLKWVIGGGIVLAGGFAFVLYHKEKTAAARAAGAAAMAPPPGAPPAAFDPLASGSNGVDIVNVAGAVGTVAGSIAGNVIARYFGLGVVAKPAGQIGGMQAGSDFRQDAKIIDDQARAVTGAFMGGSKTEAAKQLVTAPVKLAVVPLKSTVSTGKAVVNKVASWF